MEWRSTRLLLLTFTCCFTALPLIGQVALDLDSLMNRYYQIDGKNVEEIDVLNQLAQTTATSFPGISELFAIKALEKSESKGYQHGIINSYLNLATTKRTNGDLIKALENGFNAYYTCKDLGDSVRMALSLNSISMFYKDLGIQDSALNYLYQSLRLNKEDLKIRGTTLNNLGSVYLDNEQYDSAEYYYQRSIDIREEIKDYKGLGTTYGNLGILALEKENDFLKAKSLYQRSIEVKLANRDFFNLAFSYINMGNLHRNFEDYEKARVYYQKALNYADSAQAKGVMSSTYTRWARSERRAGNRELANTYDSISDALYIEVLEERQTSELKQLKAGYELKQRNRDLLLKEKDIEILEKNQKIISYQLITVSSVAMILFLVIWLQRNKRLRDKELEREKNSRLESEIEQKNNELSLITINFIQKQQMMEELHKLAKSLKRTGSAEGTQKKVKELNRIISNQIRSDKEWENFKIFFEKVHTDFFKRLQSSFSDLSITELRLAALIKMSLSIKETASILGIEPDSVKTARSRLRSKLGLDRDQNLTNFLMRF